jgi:HAD superfamily hydrolase (TIGR01549 family)
MRIRGVIFDMDGTITVPYLEFARIKEVAGIGDRDFLDTLSTVTGAEYDRLHTILTQFEQDGVANARLNRGARTLLRCLARHRLPVGLLTRNSRASVDAVCRKLRLKFDVEMTREDAPHKPAPEPIWEIGKRWGVTAAEILMVGDYKWDVLCAVNAGARSAVLLNGGETPDWALQADFIVHRLMELVPIVEGRRTKN